MFRLGRQRGRRQADHSVVRRHYFCLGARYIQELFLSADTSEAVCRYDQCKYPCYQRCHRAKTSPSSAHHKPPFLRSDRRDGTPLAARISSRPTKLLRYPELFRCAIARVYQGKGWLYIRCRGFLAETRGKGDPLYAARRYEIILFLTA